MASTFTLFASHRSRVSEVVMRILIAILFAAFAIPASANFHLWYINKVYSNSDGSVQFVEFKAAAAQQQYLQGHTLRSTSGSVTNTYTFP